MDVLDRKILNLVQEDNQLTHAEIGERVGLSTSAVRKRLVALRQSGVIAHDVSILRGDPTRIQLVVTLALASPTRQAHAQMDALIQSTPEIMTAYHVSGREDYTLIMNCESSAWYEEWSMEHLVSDPLIGPFDTRIVWSVKKQTTKRLLAD